ncbi:hypothetical protein AMAG_00093 [Allomyces macrogynus ATCC 38327]|uniref:Uncharacterized protein n=1 Tax=Allomyces macrogynus (strain ATCC 38327) TaxID=578462 RepID=A0A0L0RVJ2_ALLM3|nr:hypothetical protein AMAG_00093 [Allomyces macrogynus ATCC 38327]|eukprot:KNE54091.1 hypothetical protein AMAG_00093 [Allomyces macrogynus ATCC 38327]
MPTPSILPTRRPIPFLPRSAEPFDKTCPLRSIHTTRAAHCTITESRDFSTSTAGSWSSRWFTATPTLSCCRRVRSSTLPGACTCSTPNPTRPCVPSCPSLSTATPRIHVGTTLRISRAAGAARSRCTVHGGTLTRPVLTGAPGRGQPISVVDRPARSRSRLGVTRAEWTYWTCGRRTRSRACTKCTTTWSVDGLGRVDLFCLSMKDISSRPEATVTPRLGLGRRATRSCITASGARSIGRSRSAALRMVRSCTSLTCRSCAGADMGSLFSSVFLRQLRGAMVGV